MKNITVISLLILFSACSLFQSNLYSPLYKYRDLPIKRVSNSLINLNDHIENYQLYSEICLAEKGIISNDVYPFKTNDFVFLNSNETWIPLYYFTNTNDIEFLDANEKYISFLSNDELIVIQTNGVNIYTRAVNPSNFILAMANKESSMIAYGEMFETAVSGVSIFRGGHHVCLYDLDNSNEIALPDSYGLIGFSTENQYIFFNVFTQNHYSSISETSGPIQIYCFRDNSIQSIGDFKYEFDCRNAWCDVTVGINKQLTKLYIYENFDGAVSDNEYTDKRIDGRTSGEIRGLWEVDISSLGLSE